VVIWLLCITLVGVFCWGQHWKNIAWRITDIVNEILEDEREEPVEEDHEAGDHSDLDHPKG